MIVQEPLLPEIKREEVFLSTDSPTTRSSVMAGSSDILAVSRRLNRVWEFMLNSLLSLFGGGPLGDFGVLFFAGVFFGVFLGVLFPPFFGVLIGESLDGCAPVTNLSIDV